jgi:hypothetical protein
MVNTAFLNHLFLEDPVLRLEPLEEKHFELLLPTALNESLWLFTPVAIQTKEDF